MTAGRRGAGVGVTCVGIAVMAWHASATSRPGNATASAFPDGPGRETFESVCSLCHDPDVVVGKQWSAAQWEAKVLEMLQEEPDVTADERAAIVTYLSAHFKPGGKIYINRASAKDLAPMLDIPLVDAEALVRHRDGHGGFKTTDDVKKVPGVDAAKIDARRDRFEF